MRYLALDQSTKNVGWAFYIDGVIQDYGLISSKDKNVYVRIIYMCQEVIKLIDKFSPEIIVMEDTFMNLKVHNSILVFKALCMLQGGIIMACDSRGISFIMLTASEWRKAIDINVRQREQQKQEAIDFVKLKFNIDVEGKDDIAEAISMGYAYNLMR